VVFCENEIDHFFISVLNDELLHSFKVVFNLEEVSAVDWIS
jgi:hypothetical protein